MSCGHLDSDTCWPLRVSTQTLCPAGSCLAPCSSLRCSVLAVSLFPQALFTGTSTRDRPGAPHAEKRPSPSLSWDRPLISPWDMDWSKETYPSYQSVSQPPTAPTPGVETNSQLKSPWPRVLGHNRRGWGNQASPPQSGGRVDRPLPQSPTRAFSAFPVDSPRKRTCSPGAGHYGSGPGEGGSSVGEAGGMQTRAASLETQPA